MCEPPYLAAAWLSYTARGKLSFRERTGPVLWRSVGELSMRTNLTLVLVALALGSAGNAWATGGPINGTAPPSPTARQVTSNGQPLEEVTVVGKTDLPTLKHEIHQFVQSHGKPSTLIGQIGRWREKVCPAVTGLQGAAAEVVSHQIENVARSVGAPTVTSGKQCSVNIEVVFTGQPQALLDHIATTKYHPLLGYYRETELKQVTTFSHPVQAWYMTGTRSLDAGLPIAGLDFGHSGAETGADDITSILSTGLKIDSAAHDGSLGFGASGNPESYFTKGLRSEFMHVLIIVDSKAVAKYSLRTISDYIALFALTRIGSQDTCSGLSSILTLFDAGCGQPPAELTSADTAYLKALYGADLDMKLALEQGDIREQMLQTISSK
jgi:hypothetical protein